MSDDAIDGREAGAQVLGETLGVAGRQGRSGAISLRPPPLDEHGNPRMDDDECVFASDVATATSFVEALMVVAPDLD